jgi:hypothetical protein
MSRVSRLTAGSLVATERHPPPRACNRPGSISTGSGRENPVAAAPDCTRGTVANSSGQPLSPERDSSPRDCPALATDSPSHRPSPAPSKAPVETTTVRHLATRARNARLCSTSAETFSNGRRLSPHNARQLSIDAFQEGLLASPCTPRE